MPSERRDALVSPRCKEGIKALFDILFRSHVPFALGHLDDGIRLAAHVKVGPIGGLAGVVIEISVRRLARELFLIEMVRELIHVSIIAQNI